jgi:hypothetical protein
LASNGRLPQSALSPIAGGFLEHEAARAWNDMNAKAGGGLRPTGPNSSYRTFERQVYYWNLYVQGRGNLAARPGTSNHGWGRAVDLAAPWMRTWIDQHGAAYGWRKIEAPSEWWHVNYVGGYHPKPKLDKLKPLGKKQRKAAEQLLFHRRQAIRQAKSGKGPRYLRHVGWREWWKRRVIRLYKRAKGQEKRVLGLVLKDRDGRL